MKTDKVNVQLNIHLCFECFEVQNSCSLIGWRMKVVKTFDLPIISTRLQLLQTFRIVNCENPSHV